MEPQHASWNKIDDARPDDLWIQSYLVLHHIPCLGDTLVPWQVEVPHSHFHLLLHEGVHLSPEQPNCPDWHSLNHQHCSEQCGVEQEQLSVRGDHTNTAKGGDEEEDAAKAGENDWQVEKFVTKEIKMMTICSLEYKTTDDEEDGKNLKIQKT